MNDAAPQLEIVGDGELSDDAINALATLLLDLVERESKGPDGEEEGGPAEKIKGGGRGSNPARRESESHRTRRSSADAKTTSFAS